MAATALAHLPRELAHWSAAAAPMPMPMPMTPPHSDRLALSRHTNANPQHQYGGEQHYYSNAGQLLTPPDDTPPREPHAHAHLSSSSHASSSSQRDAYAPPSSSSSSQTQTQNASTSSSQIKSPPSPSHPKPDADAAADADDAPLAWTRDWLHPWVARSGRTESAALVAEKTCEMICYLWFAASPTPASNSNSTAGVVGRRMRGIVIMGRMEGVRIMGARKGKERGRRRRRARVRCS
ncbi:hypothetical protein K438DRAFT_713934 [Mycena galopus ATCC 62051]|nr:hypothetical protein K438DRAFT_713934 [Mycena galopus ATCC 62051]